MYYCPEYGSSVAALGKIDNKLSKANEAIIFHQNSDVLEGH